jgi:hypothetical protein
MVLEATKPPMTITAPEAIPPMAASAPAQTRAITIPEARRSTRSLMNGILCTSVQPFSTSRVGASVTHP